MDSSRLDQIRQQLETELELSDAEVGRLETELSAAKKDQKAIKDAIAALGKKPGNNTKKTVKKSDTEKAIIAQLRDQPSPVPLDELDAALRDDFVRKGYSLTGFALRLKEALKHQHITQSEQGVSYAEAAAVKS